MATVVQSIIEPNESAIKAHLETLFAPCRDEYPGGVIELRYGSPQPNQSALFGISRMDEAATWAASRNREGMNVYVGVNPRKASTRGSGSDSDVQIAFWHFADLDDAEAVEMAGKRLRTLPPTMTVTTGSEPHRRPHFYWRLDEPVGNMAAWTERQRGIASALDGDAVINPSRIMRLAGTVNFPPSHKLTRGYRVELTTLRTEFADEREPVSPDQIATAYPLTNRVTETVTPAGETTLSAMRRTRVGDLIEACCRGEQWHNNMIRLVAHLVSTGRTSAEIMALADHITLPGFLVEQTSREMAKALEGARTKWAVPEPAVDDVAAEESVREDGESTFLLLDLDELEAMPPPTWLIHEMIVDDGLTVIYGDPGAGKSFIALDMALRLTMGMDWHGAAARPTGVLYIAGEGARGIGKRIKGWRREHAMEGVDAPFLLLPVAVEMLDPKQRAKLLRTIDAAVNRAGFAIGLIVVDTVSRALAGSDENGQEAMGAFVAACDEIKRHAGGALIGVHHSGKDKDKGMRGSTVLLGACDASIRISKSERTVTLKTEKQKDAEEAAPIYMEMKKVAWATGLEEEQSTLVPFRSEAPSNQDEDLGKDQIIRAFGVLSDAWAQGRPMSHRPETKKDGRYAPRILSMKLGGESDTWARYLNSWLETGCLSVDMVDKTSKVRGLRVLDPVT